MLSRFSFFRLLTLLAVLLAAIPIQAAEDDGRADLDKATEAKLSASQTGSLNDLGEAIRLAESALQKGLDAPGTEFAKRLLGSAYLQRGQETIKQVIVHPTGEENARKQCQSAISDLEKAIEYEPKQPQAYFWLAQLNLLPGGKGVKKVVALLDKAIELGGDDSNTKGKALVLRSNFQTEPEKKKADLDQAVQLLPDEPSVVRARGLTLADMDKPELALADLSKALDLDPTSGPTYEAKAIVLARLKRYDEAVAVLDKAIKLNPKSLSPLVQRAKIHSQQHKFDNALEDMNQALAIDPSNVALLVLRAGIHQEKGEKDKALADLDSAMKLKPAAPMLIRTRALFLAQSNRLDEAIIELQKLADQDPKDALTLLQLAMLYTTKKTSAKAIDTYQKVLALTPDDLRAVRGLGDALLNMGRQTEAIAQYEKVLKAEPKDEGTLNNLAWVLCTSPNDKIRNGRRAVELATKACEVTEYKRPHILSTLAAAYAEIGDFDNAIKWITKGLELAETAKDTDLDGGKETKEALKRELENYKVKKPTRELLSEENPAEKKP